MQFITTGNRIAVENFVLGDLYTITFTNGTYINSACIGIGENFVSFQRNEPELLFSLTMATAELVSSIELYAGGSGTNNYNDLTNKPQINDVELVGNKSLSDLGIQATISDIDTIRSGAAAGATAVQPAALAGYQTIIDSSHKLDADLVDDTTATHKFATAAQLAQIGINENNISLLCDANGKKQLIPNFGILTNGSVTYTHNSDSTITITGSKGAGTENYVDIVQKSYEDYGLKSGDTIQVVNRDSAPVILAIIFTSSTSASSPNYTLNGTNTYTLPENYTGFRIRLLLTSSSTNVNVTINPLVCNKALYDISSAITPYSKSNAELTAAEKQNETNISTLENNILYNCIYGGANLCPINSGTTTGAAFVFDWTNTGIIPAGVYEFSFETSATTGAVACETQDSDGTRTGYRVITLPAKTGDITISDGTAKIRVFANAAMTLSKIRLVPSSFKDTPYQPYTMSNAELTAAIQALQAQLNQ